MGELRRLTYVSRADLGGDESFVRGVASIVASSRHNNDAVGLTAAIAFHGGRFVQILEGPEAAVETTFERVARDARHRDVIVLDREDGDQRLFPNESMVLVGRSAVGRRVLGRLAEEAGGTLEGVDAHTLASTIRDIASAEALEGAAPKALDRNDGSPTVVSVAGGILDTQRLRSELADGQPGLTPVLPSPEQEAVESLLAIALVSAEGVVIRANAKYCALLGHDPGAIAGLPYEALVAASDVDRLRALWASLASGKTVTLRHRALRSGGDEAWLESTFRPRLGEDGRLLDVVEIARDQTDRQLQHFDHRGQILAINAFQAVVHFGLDGVVLDANPLFLDCMGYTLEEVRGRHHSIFVDDAQAKGEDYRAFWNDLAAGQHKSGEYRRIGRDGRAVWLQATYNPILDMGGRPFKIVEYASVVTAAKLRQAEDQWQIAAIHKSHAVITYDLHGIVLDANALFLEAVGYSRDEIVGRHHRMFVEPSYAHGAEYHAFWRELAQGRHQAGQYKRRGQGGREVWLQATYNPVFDADGKPFKVVKYATVVTDERLRQAEHQGQIAAIHKAQCVISFDLDGTILDANDNFLDAVGYRLADVRGKHHRMFVDATEGAAEASTAFWSSLAAGHHHAGEYKRIGRDGREVWLQATYNPILDMSGRPFRVVTYATDVTAAVAFAEAYEDADRQAQHDSATALPNRVLLASFMASALAEPDARLVVLYIDLDRFKPINDAFGHEVGDRVLGEIADRLRRSISDDQLLARVGGDEFVVAAPDLKEEDIESLCHQLMACAAAPIRHDGGDLQISLSIGIAVSPADARAPDELLRCADAALYRSKQSGRATYSFYAAAMNDRILSYRTAVEDIRRGLAADEFFLEYQPRFDMRTRAVRTFEALVRWQHPQRGRIAPTDFIPVAERSGLITQLGCWVLRTACRAARAWNGVSVSVNVSPVQFRNDDLATVVRDALVREGLPPERLELEITEGVLMDDAHLARKALGELKKLGVKLAMDDFGTGYSSLSTLRNFPFDVIKIDRQFISDLDNRQGGREVVQAILGLGKALGLSVTAEGVETEQQLAALASDGCHEVQGYLLGRPMSAKEVEVLLEGASTGERAHPMPTPIILRAS